MRRDYQQVIDALEANPRLAEAPQEARMQAVVEALWASFSQRGYSWVGFYLEDPQAPGEERLVLGPRRDKPACSPIGLHGVCGQAHKFGRTRLVGDVAELGDEYIACDPRDRSEIVIPLFESAVSESEGKGRPPHCWGVLDVDSWEPHTFSEHDEIGLCLALRKAGFETPTPGEAS